MTEENPTKTREQKGLRGSGHRRHRTSQYTPARIPRASRWSTSVRNPSVRDGNPDSEAEPSRNFWNLRFSDDSDLPNCLGTESALIGTRQLACGAHTSALGVFKNGSIIRP